MARIVIFKYEKNGTTIIPEQRIYIYEWLLERIKIKKESHGWMYMCNQLENEFGKKFNINTIKGSTLPELAKQRPERDNNGEKISGDMAWYDSFVYDERIKHVEDAIALWNKKYKKVQV